jgi:predicted nucleic acid-binding protein
MRSKNGKRSPGFSFVTMQAMAAAVLMPVPQLWQEAESLQARHNLSRWDALLVAACIHGGVTTL